MKALRVIAGSIQLLSVYIVSKTVPMALPHFLRLLGARVGASTSFGYRLTTKSAHKLQIGEGVKIADNVTLACRGVVTIGAQSVIGRSVQINSSQHSWTSPTFEPKTNTVFVGRRVVIGPGSIIMPGTIIGDDCVLLPGSVVGRSWPSRSVIAGNPPRIIGTKYERAEGTDSRPTTIMQFPKDTRKSLNLVLGSVQMVLIQAVGWFPNSAIRAMVWRMCGASVGRGCAIHHGIQVRVAHRLTVGKDVFIADNVLLDARGSLTVGDHTSINFGVQIYTAGHDWESPEFSYKAAPVLIGHHCWISASSIILPGVRIGNGAVIAAGSVVTKDVPEWCLVGGNPARKLRDRPLVNRYELRAYHSKMWWW